MVFVVVVTVNRQPKATVHWQWNKPTMQHIYSTSVVMLHNRRRFTESRGLLRGVLHCHSERKQIETGPVLPFHIRSKRLLTGVLFLSNTGCKHGHRWHHEDRSPLLSFTTTPIHAISRKIHPRTKEPSNKLLVEGNKTQPPLGRKRLLLLRSIYVPASLVWMTKKKKKCSNVSFLGQRTHLENWGPSRNQLL